MTLIDALTEVITAAAPGWTVDAGWAVDPVEWAASTRTPGRMILLSYDGDEPTGRLERGRAVWRQVWNLFGRGRAMDRGEAATVMAEFRAIRTALDGVVLTTDEGVVQVTCTASRPDLVAGVAMPMLALAIQ